MTETSSVPIRQPREPPAAVKADWRRGMKTLPSWSMARGFPSGEAKVRWYREDDTG
jgi:hypothetical protein